MVGSWNSTWPVGATSVQANGITGRTNTTYVEANLTLDHFWNEDGAKDGHHKFVQMPKTETGATPDNPAIAGSMDGALYLKEKTSAEAPDYQAVLPFFFDGTTASTHVMEMLGIRACSLVEVSAAGLVTEKYSHNISSIAPGTTGVFTATFANALPSNDYLVIGGAIRNSTGASNLAYFSVDGSKTIDGVKSTTTLKYRTTTFSGSPAAVWPLSVWFVAFGG